MFIVHIFFSFKFISLLHYYAHVALSLIDKMPILIENSKKEKNPIVDAESWASFTNVIRAKYVGLIKRQHKKKL